MNVKMTCYFLKNELIMKIQRLEKFLKSEFITVDYTDAIEILENTNKTFEFPVSWGIDSSSEHERYLAEEHFDSPAVVVNYLKDIKAFT